MQEQRGDNLEITELPFIKGRIAVPSTVAQLVNEAENLPSADLVARLEKFLSTTKQELDDPEIDNLSDESLEIEAKLFDPLTPLEAYSVLNELAAGKHATFEPEIGVNIFASDAHRNFWSRSYS